MHALTQLRFPLVIGILLLTTACGPDTSTTGDQEGAVARLAPEQGLVLVDFYADWCGPCRALAPVLERVEKEGTAQVVKINVDEERDLAREAGVRSLPSVFVVKDGKVLDKLVGAKSYEQLMEELREYLPGA